MRLKYEPASVPVSWLPASRRTGRVCRPPCAAPAKGAAGVFFTLVTGPRRSLSLKMSDTRVYAPQIRGARLPPPLCMTCQGLLCKAGFEQLLHRNVQRFRGGLVCKAHRLLYHSTLGLRVIKKKKRPAKGGASCRPNSVHTTQFSPNSGHFLAEM